MITEAQLVFTAGNTKKQKFLELYIFSADIVDKKYFDWILK
jgi:hypothetical protein